MAYCVHTICIENGFKLHFSTTYTSSNIKIEAWKHVWVVSLFAKFQRTSLLNHFHPHDDLCNLRGKLGNRSDIRHTASFHRNCNPPPLFYIQIKPEFFFGFLEYQGVCHSLSMIFNYQNLDLKSLQQAAVIPN